MNDFRGDSAEQSLLVDIGQRNTREWHHITVCISIPTTTKLVSRCLHNGLNHYIHPLPFTEKFNFGFYMARKTNSVFIVKKTNKQKNENKNLI